MNKAKANKEANARLEFAKTTIERAKLIRTAPKQTVEVPKPTTIVSITSERRIRAYEATVSKVQHGSKHIFRVYVKTSLHSDATAVGKAFTTSTKAHNWIVDHIEIVK